jgi:hypothetical protein
LTTNLVIQHFDSDKRPFTLFTDNKLEEIMASERKDQFLKSMRNVVEKSGNNICIVWNSKKEKHVKTLIDILSYRETNTNGRKIILISFMPNELFPFPFAFDMIPAPVFTKTTIRQDIYHNKFAREFSKERNSHYVTVLKREARISIIFFLMKLCANYFAENVKITLGQKLQKVPDNYFNRTLQTTSQNLGNLQWLEEDFLDEKGVRAIFSVTGGIFVL